MTVQLDLFGAVVAAEEQRDRAERQRLIDGLTCLRDVVPTALECVVDLRYTASTDTRAPSKAMGDSWAYCISRAGLRFETVAEWAEGARSRGERYGWDRTPAHLLTWDELATLVGTDPRRAEVVAWARSLPVPNWRPLYRPHELWPLPDHWHVGVFCHDHVDVHWTARRHAWQLVLDMLGDAIDGLQGGC